MESVKRLCQMDIVKYLSQLMTLQIASKVINLGLTFATARIVDKEVYGYANVQLAFFLSCCLFWWRECVRRTIQQIARDPKQNLSQLISYY